MTTLVAFDYRKAMQGSKVFDDTGNPVRILNWEAGLVRDGVVFDIVAVVKHPSYPEDGVIRLFNKVGQPLSEVAPCLKMEAVETRVYFNIYKMCALGPFNSKEEADIRASTERLHVHEVTWYE